MIYFDEFFIRLYCLERAFKARLYSLEEGILGIDEVKLDYDIIEYVKNQNIWNPLVYKRTLLANSPPTGVCIFSYLVPIMESITSP